MASRAVCEVRSTLFDASGLKFYCDISIMSGLRHNSLLFGPISPDTLLLTIQGTMNAWAKAYAAATMGETFGLLDGVRIINCDLV